MAKNEDSLFLLEVLIDKVVFVKSPCFSDKDFRTCVNIECPAVQPLEICDDDPEICIARSGGPFVKTFNNGKSCLFSLKEADISAAMSKFPVKVSVYKSLPCGCLPTKIIMGEATIDMTKEFVQARNKYLEDPTNVSYEALKDSFRIVGSDGTESGEILMFLRISCFGKLIITKFQGGSGAPNLGAGGSNTIVDRSCTSKRDFQTTQDPCACGAARGGSGKAGSGHGKQSCLSGGGGVCHSARDPYNSMPCEDPDDPCYCSGPMQPPKQNMVCRNTDQYCLHVPKDCCPTGNKVVFQMPSDSCGTGHKQRAHFNYTSDGIGDVAREEPGQLMPITAEDYQGVVYDFPQQVIKLRIGKTVEMPGRKSKLEYHFVTPAITHERVVPVKDTRTAQCTPCCRSPCCSSRPKCAPPRAHVRQELSGEQKIEIKPKDCEEERLNELIVAFIYEHKSHPKCKINHSITKRLKSIVNKTEHKEKFRESSNTSISSTKYTKLHSSSLFRMFLNSDSSYSKSAYETDIKVGMFGKRETEVYMNLFNDFTRYRASGTQATAFINKCLQVNSEISSRCEATTLDTNSNYDSTCTVSTLPSHQPRRATIESGQYHEVYFFGRKKDKSAGMGYKESKVKIHRTVESPSTTGRKSSSSSVVNTASVQTKNIKGASTATTTTKAVSIKEDKPKKPCPAGGQTKGDMTATISHIRIGPRESCPVHGKEPCQGPKCIVAISGEEQAPVKVTTVTNPRRGVFEIVIRKITGAPLAKNELMLEWTPPPSRPPPCGVPCSIPCAIPTPCRPPKCKMIVCKPSKCKPKCCKKPCGPIPCKRCYKVSCCGKKCTPCGPPVCNIPCSVPCATPCCSSPCGSPCKSSPCLRPCPVGRKRPRKARSQPKIRAHRKRTSPCLNRSKVCPVVRCRSMPGPCVGCCYVPPCPPRKCCSVAPCKPPKCCKSSCSMCCP